LPYLLIFGLATELLGVEVIAISVLGPANEPSETSIVQVLSSLVKTTILVLALVAETVVHPALGKSVKKNPYISFGLCNPDK
jgi:hypothetical protein